MINWGKYKKAYIVVVFGIVCNVCLAQCDTLPVAITLDGGVWNMLPCGISQKKVGNVEQMCIQLSYSNRLFGGIGVRQWSSEIESHHWDGTKQFKYDFFSILLEGGWVAWKKNRVEVGIKADVAYSFLLQGKYHFVGQPESLILGNNTFGEYRGRLYINVSILQNLGVCVHVSMTYTDVWWRSLGNPRVEDDVQIAPFYVSITGGLKYSFNVLH